MIAGYPASASIWPGDTTGSARLDHARRFRVLFYRWTDSLVPMFTHRLVAGKMRSAARRRRRLGLARLSVSACAATGRPPSTSPSLTRAGGAPPVSWRPTRAAILFVVRGPAQSKLLYKLPLATYHAYNFTGGGCFYKNPPRSLSPPGRQSLVPPARRRHRRRHLRARQTSTIAARRARPLPTGTRPSSRWLAPQWLCA